jgi:hypothetical protein
MWDRVLIFRNCFKQGIVIEMSLPICLLFKEKVKGQYIGIWQSLVK